MSSADLTKQYHILTHLRYVAVEIVVRKGEISPFYKMFSTLHGTYFPFQCHFNPFPHMPNFGSSNLATNKDMMSRIWINRDIII